VTKIETALSVADMGIAEFYADNLVEPALRDKYFPLIKQEYETSKQAVLQMLESNIYLIVRSFCSNQLVYATLMLTH